MQVNSLLSTIAAKVDHGRVVQLVRKANQLPLILPFLKQIQPHNSIAVNEAINELYAESEQYEELRQSIDDFDNFDQIALAKGWRSTSWSKCVVFRLLCTRRTSGSSSPSSCPRGIRCLRTRWRLPVTAETR